MSWEADTRSERHFKHSIEEKDGTDEWGIPSRIFEARTGDVVVATAEVKMITNPIPLIFLDKIHVPDDADRSKNYASSLMHRIERFIHSQKKLGLLYSQILGAKHSRVQGMYERHGWRVVPGRSSLMYFNADESSPLDELSYIYDEGIEFMYLRGERGIVDIS